MASLFRNRVVRHVDEDGRRIPRGTPGAKIIREKSRVWYGQYKDASGKWRRVPLFTDKLASQRRLAEIVTAVERGEAGLVSPHKEHLARPVAEHVRDYLANLRTGGVNPKHFSERSRILNVVLAACGV